MPNPAEVISVVVALECVVVSSIVLLLVPLDAAVSLIPLLLVFLVALHAYRS
ncbi:hypothetical protein [Haloferax profundi]|uniref:hypothetical protein n=1 Tax=Haloferax profundi TaxID=1544718 RepID=UPI000ADA7E7B|nr:hypothetical protein [Haloferax profundi]